MESYIGSSDKKEFDCMADQLEKNINDLKETMESQNQFIGNFYP